MKILKSQMHGPLLAEKWTHVIATRTGVDSRHYVDDYNLTWIQGLVTWLD